MGSRQSGGYGDFKKEGKHYLAHRVAYESQNGPLGDGMQACHKCDVRCCINPEHLFAGTNLDNIRDMQSKGRNRVPKNRPSGLVYRPQKRMSLPMLQRMKSITPIMAETAFAMRNQGDSYYKIAKHLDVSYGTARRVILGRR